MTATAEQLKSKKVAWVLWFFLGMLFGAHRMYLNRMGSGLFTMCVGFFAIITSLLAFSFYVFIFLAIWWIIEAFRLNKMVDAENEFILSGGLEDQD